LSGFFKDAKFNLEGFNKVLELRQKFQGHSIAQASNVFYDEHYYQSALELI